MDHLDVLFVCVGNSCRSAIAEAIARDLGGGQVRAYSAGLAPAGFIADETLNILAELGYSTEGLHSKGLEDLDRRDYDVVVSLLGDRGLDMLPSGMGCHREAWSIPDPFGEEEEVYRSVARLLEKEIRVLIAVQLDAELSIPEGLSLDEEA